ncbi:MAG TPA: SDR family NAD(P)-dependent oxidoreductase [Verrucomicrobiae bacterium]|nr:SDR family NAD(P)-dependent oxidoreductase [Verrucomicrobiae bacterium]
MNPAKKTVVITGASSGIGRASVEQMSRAGWQVFATVRKPAEREALLASNLAGVFPVIMDVRDRASIAGASATVAAHVRQTGLDGLVNVAGIGMMRPMEYAASRDIQEIFDINVFGQIAIIQAFLPLIRPARGRIVNITSIGAHVAIPFGGLLNGSKSAFGILSDTLRLELLPFGIRVSTIEPGAISTPAVDKTLGDVEGVIRNLPTQGQFRYGSLLRAFARQAYAREKAGSSPNVVANAVRHALTSAHPRVRYRVGKHAKLLTNLPRILPDWLLDALRMRMFRFPKFGSLNADDRDQPTDRRAA